MTMTTEKEHVTNKDDDEKDTDREGAGKGGKKNETKTKLIKKKVVYLKDSN